VKSTTLKEAAHLWYRGDQQAALGLAETLYSENSGDKDVAVFFSGLLLHLEQFERARQVLKKTLDAVTDHPPLLVNLSIAQRACGLVEQSVVNAEKAVELDPTLVSAWNALLSALNAAGRKSAAADLLQIALTYHPEAASLQQHLALLERAQGLDSDQRSTKVVSSLTQEARRLISRGALGPAEQAYRQALRVDHGNAIARSGLGILLVRLGRLDEAVPELMLAVASNPDDHAARHFLDVARGVPQPIANKHYVRELFDTYAADFDEHLSRQLCYRVPEDLTTLVKCHVGAELGQVLDLGCGTGLVGQYLSTFCQAIDGVDLSTEMLSRARARGCYRELHLAEISEFLSDAQVSWHAVTAADVFIYYGYLNHLFKDIHRRLQPGGWFAFSVESTDEDGFRVNPASGRYQHSRCYLEQSMVEAGFSWRQFLSVVVRMENGEPIPGWIVLAQGKP